MDLGRQVPRTCREATELTVKLGFVLDDSGRGLA